MQTLMASLLRRLCIKFICSIIYTEYYVAVAFWGVVFCYEQCGKINVLRDRRSSKILIFQHCEWIRKILQRNFPFIIYLWIIETRRHSFINLFIIPTWRNVNGQSSAARHAPISIYGTVFVTNIIRIFLSVES